MKKKSGSQHWVDPDQDLCTVGRIPMMTRSRSVSQYKVNPGPKIKGSSGQDIFGLIRIGGGDGFKVLRIKAHSE